jgi:hypothetical protein
MSDEIYLKSMIAVAAALHQRADVVGKVNIETALPGNRLFERDAVRVAAPRTKRQLTFIGSRIKI